MLEGRPAEWALAEPVRSQTVRAFADSITTTFAWAIPVVIVAIFVFVRVPVIPLRDDQ